MINKLKSEIKEYFVGNDKAVDNLLICLLAQGHALLEDVPGVGKTTLAKIISKLINCDFGRIQFTPDTLPGDIVGTEIYNMKTGEFSVKTGLIMHQIILADEINRTSPKTQSSLLEAMAEEKITIGDECFELPQPFMVIATQNPVEYMGTYPLPEAQLDRFMMKLSLGYPSEEEEVRLAKNFIEGKCADDIKSILETKDILRMREEVKKVVIKDEVLAYLEEIVRQTRSENKFVIGASPRAMLSLIRASQARAFIDGRDFVKPDDIKNLAVPVLAHRLSLTTEAKIARENVEKVLTNLVLKVKVPMM